MDEEELLERIKGIIEKRKQEMMENNKEIDVTFEELRKSLPEVIKNLKTEKDIECLREMALRDACALIMALEMLKKMHNLLNAFVK